MPPGDGAAPPVARRPRPRRPRGRPSRIGRAVIIAGRVDHRGARDGGAAALARIARRARAEQTGSGCRPPRRGASGRCHCDERAGGATPRPRSAVVFRRVDDRADGSAASNGAACARSCDAASTATLAAAGRRIGAGQPGCQLGSARRCHAAQFARPDRGQHRRPAAPAPRRRQSWRAPSTTGLGGGSGPNSRARWRTGARRDRLSP